MQRLQIRKCSFVEIRPLVKFGLKEHCSFANNENCEWIGAFWDGKACGCNCVMRMGNKYRIKSSFVLSDFRGQGIYNKMFEMAMGFIPDGAQITAYCTKMSLNTFLRYGFKVISENVKGIKYVVYEQL